SRCDRALGRGTSSRLTPDGSVSRLRELYLRNDRRAALCAYMEIAAARGRGLACRRPDDCANARSDHPRVQATSRMADSLWRPDGLRRVAPRPVLPLDGNSPP